MSDDRTIERSARAWLELGPTRAPDHAVEAALRTVDTTSQERDLWIPWRLPTMNPVARMAILASVVIVAAVGGIYLLRPATQSVGGPRSSAATASPTSTLAAPALQMGTYVGPTLQVTDIIASMNTNSDLTSLEKTKLINELFAIKDKTTWSASIELRGGRYTQRQTADGVTVVGSAGRYTFPDDHTIELVETGSQSGTRFAIAVVGDTFTLRSLTPPPNALDAFVVRTLFEATFTLVR